MSDTPREILLIAPRADSLLGYVDALKRAGFTVVAVTSCRAARRSLDIVTPRLIIASFDVRTREECLEFVERVKRDPRTRDIPILLTSAFVTHDDLQRATDINVLGVAAGVHDGEKIAAAVRGVLTATAGRRSA
jgi:CheY-like chemotaxis protein